MSNISRYTGTRIRKCRKEKNLTIEALGRLIDKSKATISKYENGSVSIDLDTLSDIAKALDVDIMTLIDYEVSEKQSVQTSKNTYFNYSKMYLYYYDGRTNKIIRSLIFQVPTAEERENSPIKVIMYQGVESFDNPEKSQHIFTGEMLSYDTITHFFLTNQVNRTEKAYCCIFNPLHANSPGIGMLSGIASNPFFGPIALKIVISKEILQEDTALLNVIKLQQIEHKIFEELNMMAINRPNSLFLNPQK